MGFCMCLSSGGSTDRNQIYEVNDYGQENAVLYSEQHDVPQDVGSVSSLTGGKGFNQDAAILHLVLEFKYNHFEIKSYSKIYICFLFPQKRILKKINEW